MFEDVVYVNINGIEYFYGVSEGIFNNVWIFYIDISSVGLVLFGKIILVK